MLPQLLQQFVQKASEGTLRIRVDNEPYAELRREIQASARRRDQTIVGAVVLLAGILWLAFRTDWMPGVLLTAAGLLAGDGDLEEVGVGLPVQTPGALDDAAGHTAHAGGVLGELRPPLGDALVDELGQGRPAGDPLRQHPGPDLNPQVND